jgi:hypothetical protein
MFLDAFSKIVLKKKPTHVHQLMNRHETWYSGILGYCLAKKEALTHVKLWKTLVNIMLKRNAG